MAFNPYGNNQGGAGGMLGQLGNELGMNSPQPGQAVAPVPANYGQAGAGAPGQQKMDSNAPLGDYQFLQGHDRLLLRQRFQLLESLAGLAGFDMIEFSNKYDIYDANTGEPLLFAAEESDCLCRACCAPHHRAKLHVFDVRNGGNSPVFTVDKPFKWNCCIWMDCCQQRQTTMRGDQKLGGSAQHFPCGGCFRPVVDINDPTGKRHELRGPCCAIGGAIELCMDQEFGIHDTSGQKVGRVVHMKPADMKEGLQQFAGNNDNYLMELPPGMPADETANMVSTLLLLDYLFFEGGPPCGVENGSLVLNICNLYCCGCICPCTCGGGGGDNGGGVGGGMDFGGGF